MEICNSKNARKETKDFQDLYFNTYIQHIRPQILKKVVPNYFQSMAIYRFEPIVKKFSKNITVKQVYIRPPSDALIHLNYKEELGENYFDISKDIKIVSKKAIQQPQNQEVKKEQEVIQCKVNEQQNFEGSQIQEMKQELIEEKYQVEKEEKQKKMQFNVGEEEENEIKKVN